MKKPSVTQLLSLLDKPGLLKWANKIGLEGTSLDDYRLKSTQKGTSLHKQVEDFILDGVEMEDKDCERNCISFLDQVEVLGVEQKSECDLYRGKYDIKYKYNDKILIGDFKSSQRVYLNQKLQLCAYKNMEGAGGITHIHLPSFKVTEVIVDYDSALELLDHLAAIYHLKQTLE